MELETIDEQSGSFPVEAIEEIRSMASWMTVTGVTLIILNILFALAYLIQVTKGDNSRMISILTSSVGIYLGFLIIRKSGLFTSYANGRDEQELIEAMKLTKLYWTISVLLMILSIILSITIR